MRRVRVSLGRARHAGVLLACLTATACSQRGSPGVAQVSAPTVPTSTAPTSTAPASTAPASTAPVPTVTVSGTVQDGAAPSCRLLFTVDRHYLLLGPQAATLAVDSTVTVTGHLAAGGRFSCGGIPLSVTGVLRR